MALTFDQHTTLLAAIAGDGVLAAYPHNPDGAFALMTYFNAVTEAGLKPIPIAEVLIWAALNDRYSTLEAHISDTGGVGTICKVALLILTNPQVANLDLADPTISGLLDSLVTVGVLTPTDRDDLAGLAATVVSRAQALIGVPTLTLNDILGLWVA